MKTIVALALAGVAVMAQSGPSRPGIIGRWDLTVKTARGERPSWLEVRHSGVSTLVGQFVGSGGSARPISRVEFKDGEFRFAIPPQWERVDGDLVVTGRLDGDRLTGKMTLANQAPQEWTGVRAPELRRTSDPVWGAAVPLLKGPGLQGWHATSDRTNEWELVEGILRNKKSGANLVTDSTFEDFKLHIEFRYPKGGNSGIYLRGRYELQIADMDAHEQTEVGALGAVYGFLAPTQPAAGKPGDWQTIDVTLTGRIVSVVLNGKRIITEAEIPGITGGALDSREGEPGPLYLQGDHTAAEFRNITITPARR